MSSNSQTVPDSCTSCGGELKRISTYEYQCTSCGRKYYVSADRLHKISFRLSVGKTILYGMIAAIVIGSVAVAGYQFYTGHMVASASRFSVVFRDFLMEAYEKPVAEIGEEDLSRMKYLKIEKEDDYCFTYGFEDFYDYGTMESYEKTLSTIRISGKKDDFSPTNIQYFTGLTRLELYTEAWQNYMLPQDNVLRCITCVNGLSRYGTPEFFNRVNPDTLEEVLLLQAEDLDDFSFMENLRGIKGFLLEDAQLKNVEMFQGFDDLEQLVLYHVTMEEEDAYELVDQLLSLPSLKVFAISGKSAWYITDEEWQQLQETYKDRIVIVRE